MAGGKGKLNHDKTARRALDFYPTPAECTRALFAAELPFMAVHGFDLWEPCGRGGAIARVADRLGFRVAATDIVADPVNAVLLLDLLDAREARAPLVVTNPPFALARPMIAHLLGKLDVRYLALLLKTTFWSADNRHGLWRAHPPARRWDMTFRPDFLEGASRKKGSGSTMNCSWFVWDSLAAGPPVWGLLGRDGPVLPTGPDLFAAAS
ncbi:MAG TPA: hypothetical protein VF628_02165 [Allosphingosinicella sp.]|jgi:hypothetical protein